LRGVGAFFVAAIPDMPFLVDQHARNLPERIEFTAPVQRSLRSNEGTTRREEIDTRLADRHIRVGVH